MFEPIKPEIKDAEERGLVFMEIAKHQPEYRTLPAYFNPKTGAVTTEWTPSPEDRVRIANGESIKLSVWTGGKPLQPLYPCVEIEELEEVGAI
jgi:hypothetical protein